MRALHPAFHDTYSYDLLLIISHLRRRCAEVVPLLPAQVLTEPIIATSWKQIWQELNLLAPYISLRPARARVFSCRILIAAGIRQRTTPNSSERRCSMQDSWEQYLHWALNILLTCPRTSWPIATVLRPWFIFLEAFWGSYMRWSLPTLMVF